jgi:hypothetical protein
MTVSGSTSTRPSWRIMGWPESSIGSSRTGGELDINTAPDAGVKIRVVLPTDAREGTRYQHRAGDRRQDPDGAAGLNHAGDRPG